MLYGIFVLIIVKGSANLEASTLSVHLFFKNLLYVIFDLILNSSYGVISSLGEFIVSDDP